MLTLQQIKENPEQIIKRLQVKGFDGEGPINEILALDERRRQLQLDNDNRAAELNKHAANIGKLMKSGQREEADKQKAVVAQLKDSQKAIAEDLAKVEGQIREILLSVPNVPCDMVPEGKTAADNVVEKTGGVIPDLGENALPHWGIS
jgi:seryl-tRNA synthetase